MHYEKQPVNTSSPVLGMFSGNIVAVLFIFSLLAAWLEAFLLFRGI